MMWVMAKPTRRDIDLKLAQARAKAPKQPPAKGSPHVLYEKPTPKVSKQKKAKVLTAAERAAFLASRPDLKGK
jgi:hypothetical protein